MRRAPGKEVCFTRAHTFQGVAALVPVLSKMYALIPSSQEGVLSSKLSHPEMSTLYETWLKMLQTEGARSL